MQAVIDFVSSIGTIELIVIFVVGVILCYILGSAPSFGGFVVLALSLLAGFKVYSSTNNLIIAIPVFVITGGVLSFFSFLGQEKHKAKMLGYASLKDMNIAEVAAMKNQYTDDPRLRTSSNPTVPKISYNDSNWNYTTAHPLLGTSGKKLPLTSYERKESFLETEESNGWSMAQLVGVEVNRIPEVLEYYRYTENLPRLIELLIPLLEDNMASDDPVVVEGFDGLAEILKKIIYE